MDRKQEGGAIAAPPPHEGLETAEAYRQRIGTTGYVPYEDDYDQACNLLERALIDIPPDSTLAMDVRAFLRRAGR